jgi:leucyl-tRNA synthetase
MASYPFSEIEKKWQKYWEDKELYKITEDFSKPKFYVLDMFPYPSGAGLHIGHPEGYTASDIIGRYKRMKGFNLLHPMGFDAFGLPTERYCMEKGIHPVDATEVNIKVFKYQLKMLGLGYDWSREINTTRPGYYKWTQWMFLKIYNSWFDDEKQITRHIDELPIPSDIKTEREIEDYRDSKRLAFISMIPVNWCEQLGTVLANEEVDEWREKGYTVERRPMRQWMLRITKYAQRLLDDLKLVDWPHSTMEMQKNWIGKSEGAEILFNIENTGQKIRVFTTRPDTVFGASYLVLAPEHPLVKEIVKDGFETVINDYIQKASLKSDMERTELAKEKTGCFTGSYAVNPATKEKIPVWIADYVLAHYGTGAIMAVPGHDERDHEFARAFDLPIIKVVQPSDEGWNIQEKAYTDDGVAVNSSNDEISINGLTTEEATNKTIDWLVQKGIGERKIQFKLRDWLFSRQRYWGEPIPIMFFEDGSKRCLSEDELPLMLPELMDFKPSGTGESPLAKVESWVNFIDKKTGKRARFETNTMPQWAGSCWYYLRYIDPFNDEIFCDPKKEKYWMQPNGVDLYVGGAEHAVLHLLYARFWHKVLYDYGYVSTVEPFSKLFHQGLIIGEDGRKMSKSLGNVVNPDDVVEEYGADSLRIFEMFLGPLEASKPWSKTGIEGVSRFLSRAWRLIVDEETGKISESVQDVPMSPEQEYVLNYTIMKVAQDIEDMHFNTAVSQMMIFVNEFNKSDIKPREAMEKFILCLSSFAPHIAEELWQILGHEDSILLESYPEFDPTKVKKQEVELVLQVNSKIRSKIQVPVDLNEVDARKMATEDINVLKHIEGKTIRKVIYVPNKIINLIAN